MEEGGLDGITSVETVRPGSRGALIGGKFLWGWRNIMPAGEKKKRIL